VSAPNRAAVFLDRDGTLIRGPVIDGRPGSIDKPEDLELEDGAEEACAALRAAGFLLVVVTNQPDIARGKQTREGVERIHERLREALPLDEIGVCPHDDFDGCACRKPLPGMLLDAAARLSIDLAASFLVGDTWRDIEAGRRAGCMTVVIDREYSGPMPDMTARDLREATVRILERAEH
jgi:D-glycero-D-manno-heptose 1,7-bisphosphate phosphatase